MAAGSGWSARHDDLLPNPCFSGFAIAAALGLVVAAIVGVFTVVWPLGVLPFLATWFVALLRLVVRGVSIVWAAVATIFNAIAVTLAAWAFGLQNAESRPATASLVILAALALVAGSASAWSSWVTAGGRYVSTWVARYGAADEDRFIKPTQHIKIDLSLPLGVKWLMLGMPAALAVAYGYGIFWSDWFVALFPYVIAFVVITYRAVMRDKPLTGDGVVLLINVLLAVGILSVTGASLAGGGVDTLLGIASVACAALGVVASRKAG